MLAKVVGIADPPTEGGLCDRYRPHYAVDLLVLTPQLTIDTTKPRYDAVALPHDMIRTLPEPGTIVELAFAYGDPSLPIIRSIQSHGQTLPPLQPDEQLWHHSPAVNQSVDAAGNWQRVTDQHINDSSLNRTVTATHASHHYHHSDKVVDTDELSTVGGSQLTDVLGALKILVGEKGLIAALDTLQIGSDKELKLSSTTNTTLTAGAELQVLAAELNKQVAPKNWAGSDSVNLYQVVSDLIGVVSKMNQAIITHAHPPPGLSNAPDFGNYKSTVDNLKSALDAIIG